MPDLTLATGTSTTAATQPGDLSARGTGVLAPSPSGEAAVSAAPGASRSEPRVCSGSLPSFPAPFSSLVSAGVACASASAASSSRTDGHASATGQALSLHLDLASILSAVVKPASPAVSALEGVLGKLPPLPAQGEPVAKILEQVAKIPPSDLVAEVAGGMSSSSTVVSPGGWSTKAESAGVTITLLPSAGIDGAPLAQVRVGSASAAASVSRVAPASGATGNSSPEATDSPALVTIELKAPGTGSRTYSVVPGQSMTILKGTPLQSTITVAAGSVTTSRSGLVTAQSHGVMIALAEGAGATPATAHNGGLHLSLASAKASARSEQAPATVAVASKHGRAPVLASSSVPNATTPHTGLPWAGAAPVLAGGALAGTGLLLWPGMKRRLRLAHHGRFGSKR